MKFLGALIFLLLFRADVDVFQWINQHLLACPFKSYIGIDCPGCGIQRSLIALMQGNLLTSVKYYPATIPILAMFSLTAVHLKFDFKNGAFFIKMLYIGVTLIIVTHYIYKIYTNQLI